MPEVHLQFRASCGNFVFVFCGFMARRVKEKVAMRASTLTAHSKTTGVMIGLLLTLLFFGDLLHRSGDIEKNPGPRGLKQTRLTSGNQASNMSSDSDRAVTPTREDTPKDPATEPTTSDLMKTLLAMNLKFDGMKEEISGLNEVFHSLQSEILSMKTEIDHLKQENGSLKTENEALRKDMASLERRTDDLEDRSRRSNLIIHGLPREDQEKPADCEVLVKKFLSDKLKITTDIPIDRAHRLSSKKNSPMIMKCTFFKDKERIMREKGNLKGSNMFIGEDFSRRVRDVRKRLIPHLKKAKSENKRATMVYDHLIIEGTKFGIDAQDNLIELR